MQKLRRLRFTMKLKDYQKALAICFIFLFLFLGIYLTGFDSDGNDVEQHKRMSLDKNYNTYYPIMFRSIGAWVVFDDTLFQILVLIILCIITPMTLFYGTKEPLAPFFYFAISSYFYFMYSGLCAQALAGIFVLAIISFKNPLAKIGLFLIGLFSHNSAFELLVMVLIISLIYEYREKIAGLLMCSPFWGKTPEILQKPVYNNNLYAPVSINNLLSFFAKIAPLPFLIIQFKKNIQNKRFDVLIIMILLIGVSFVTNHRVLYTAGLVNVFGFCLIFKELKNKKLWLSVALIWGIWLFQSWVILNTKC